MAQRGARRPVALLLLALAAAAATTVAAAGGRPLAAAEVEQLARLERGEVSKDELEVVLAQFDEDVTWSKQFEKVRTVYCKGGADQCVEGSLPLPNVGREGHTFLHHIVTNYDKLSAWTVFSQAGEPTEGYRGHAHGGGHMLTGATFNDYLLHPQRSTTEDPGAFFLITSKVHLPTMQHSMRTTYKIVEGQQVAGLKALPPMCPAHNAPKLSGDRWGPYGQVQWLRSFVSQKCGLEEASLGDAMLSFWDNFVQLPRPPADVAHFAQGARFAASRARIHQRPKAFYEKLLALVSKESDPCMNYLYEWVWYYIIGMPESTACTVVPEEMKQMATMQVRMLTAVSGVSGVSGGSGDSSKGDSSNGGTDSGKGGDGKDDSSKGDEGNGGSSKGGISGGVSGGSPEEEGPTVITGTVTLKVADPPAFCASSVAKDAFVKSMAGLSESLKVEWFDVTCEVDSSRRLSEAGRRLEGAVIMGYTISIPAGESTDTVDAVYSSVQSATSATLKDALNTRLAGTNYEVLEVESISVPVQYGSDGQAVTFPEQGTTDGHAKTRAALASIPAVLAAVIAAALLG